MLATFYLRYIWYDHAVKLKIFLDAEWTPVSQIGAIFLNLMQLTSIWFNFCG